MNLAPFIKQRFFDSNGDPLVGGKLYSYAANTTTPQATYTDQGGGTANANPVVLDANGEAPIWLDPALSYKFILKDSADSVQWTVDAAAGSPTIPASAIATANLADDAVTSAKLADHATVDASRAVTTNHIKDSAVTAAKIASDAVTTVKILNANVTTAKIADLNVTTGKIASGAVTQEKRAIGTVKTDGTDPGAGGVVYTASSGSFSGSGDVTNLSATLTTTGRPVFVGLVPDGSADSFLSTSDASDTCITNFAFYRGTTKLTDSRLEASSTGPTASGVYVPVGSLWVIDNPAAGTYVYKLTATKNAGTDSSIVSKAKMVVYEI